MVPARRAWSGTLPAEGEGCFVVPAKPGVAATSLKIETDQQRRFTNCRKYASTVLSGKSGYPEKCRRAVDVAAFASAVLGEFSSRENRAAKIPDALCPI